MTDRLLIAALVLLSVTLIAFAAQQWNRRRVKRMVDHGITLTNIADKPQVLAFTGPGCAKCHQQSQILSALQAQSPSTFELRQVDAVAEPVLARQLGVIMVPTTVVAAANGQVRAINTGLTSSQRLQEQLAAF